MLSIRDALDLLLPSFQPREAVDATLGSALGMVLARDVIASTDLPELDNSAMDGYALHVADLDAAIGGELPLTASESRAGGELPADLPAGHAMRIFTGAPLPRGADAIVMQENTSRSERGVVVLQRPTLGSHVRARGADMRAGSIALAAGSCLGAGEIGLLAAQNQPLVRVHRRPRVAILCSGDELRELGTPARPGSIVNSNAHALAAAVQLCGAEPWLLPAARDRLDELQERMREGLRADALICVGGVSVGDYDLVPSALQAVGVTLAFHKVAIKPGKPMLLGHAGPVPVLGLPGNPVSALVTFEIFVRPALLRMLGHRAPFARAFSVELAEAYDHAPGRTELARAALRVQGSRLVAQLHPRQGSGSLPSMVGSDTLVIIPRDSGHLAAGSELRAIRIADHPSSTKPPIDDRAP